MLVVLVVCERESNVNVHAMFIMTCLHANKSCLPCSSFGLRRPGARSGTCCPMCHDSPWSSEYSIAATYTSRATSVCPQAGTTMRPAAVNCSAPASQNTKDATVRCCCHIHGLNYGAVGWFHETISGEIHVKISSRRHSPALPTYTPVPGPGLSAE